MQGYIGLWIQGEQDKVFSFNDGIKLQKERLKILNYIAKLRDEVDYEVVVTITDSKINQKNGFYRNTGQSTLKMHEE